MNNYFENKFPLTFLILDLDREFELQEVLKSIKKHVKFPHQIIVKANGGKDQNYHIKFYQEGLIDQIILSKHNSGAGYGVTDLIKYCNTEYLFYLESDQIFIRDFTLEEFETYKKAFKEHISIKFFNPVGMATNGQFTLRSFLAETKFLLDIIKDAPNGGPGIYRHIKESNEFFFQEWLRKNECYSIPIQPALVFDIGAISINETAKSGTWLHLTDTKQLYLLSGPILEKNDIYPIFRDEDWKNVIETQSWPDGQIPEKEKKSSFVYWQNRDLINQLIIKYKEKYV